MNILHLFIFLICWMTVVFIPAAKVLSRGLWINIQHPRNVRIYSRNPPAKEVHLKTSNYASGLILIYLFVPQILLCTYQALNVNYFMFSVNGLNVVLVSILLATSSL